MIGRGARLDVGRRTGRPAGSWRPTSARGWRTSCSAPRSSPRPRHAAWARCSRDDRGGTAARSGRARRRRRAGRARRGRRGDGRVDGARGAAWRPDRDAARRVRGGHARATSGDQTRISRCGHGADALYTRWARESLGGWRTLESETGQVLFRQAGALWFTGEDRGFVDATVPTFEALDIPIEVLSPAEVSGRWPQIATGDITGAVYEPEAGLLMAARGCVAATRRLIELGGSFGIAAVRPGHADGDRLLDVVDDTGRRFAADGVRVRRRALAAAPVPGRRRRARQRHEAGRRLPRARARRRALDGRGDPVLGRHDPPVLRPAVRRGRRVQGRAGPLRARLGPDRRRPARRSGRRARRPRLRRPPLPRPRPAAGHRGPRLPVRDDARQPLPHRPPPGIRERVARRRRVRATATSTGRRSAPTSSGASTARRPSSDDRFSLGRPGAGAGTYRIGGDGLVAAWEATGA